MKKVQIALAKGDGSAPEMMEQATKIAIKAAEKDNIGIEFVETPMGWNAYEKYGDTLPEESLKKATELGILFFGGIGDPEIDKTIGKNHPEMLPEPRCLLRIRKEWGLLLNFRPMIFYPQLKHLAKIRPDLIPDDRMIRQIFVRFLLEDSYFGNIDLMDFIPEAIRNSLGVKLKKDVTGEEDFVSDIAYYRKDTIEKYLRAAFKYARQTNLPLISIDKSNVIARYVLWRKTCERIGKDEFPDVELRHLYVDAGNMLLFNPARLNGVIVCGNEHGDILSDGAAEAVGSLGMMCSSAINPDTNQAMFESGAGTAPTLAGQDKANPIGRILTAAMMLRHIGVEKGASAIENSVIEILKKGYRTADIALSKVSNMSECIVGTSRMGDLILENLDL